MTTGLPSFDDRVFLGEGLFETLKVEDSYPCFEQLHWARLKHAADFLGIEFRCSLDEWRTLLAAQIKHDNLIQGGLKALLTGGKASRGLVQQGHDPQLIIRSFSYALMIEPLSLVSSTWLRDAKNPLYQLKSVNYLEAILARRQAIKQGADDALFFNTKDHATEATCANLFIVYQGGLLTPPLTDGVFPGITRARLLEHCKVSSIVCEERSITKKMLYQAEAVFLTNALHGLQKIHSLDGRSIANQSPIVSLLFQTFK